MKNYIKSLLIILLIVLIIISSIIISWFGLMFVKNDNYNMNSVTKENLQFYFAAESINEKTKYPGGKSDIYLCDVASNSYTLKYSSEKYNIKYFCMENDIIYFIGEYEEKYDLVKLEKGVETMLITLDFPAARLEKVNEKLYFLKYEEKDKRIFDINFYCYDLSENRIKQVIDNKFISYDIPKVAFISEMEIYLFGLIKDKNNKFTNSAYSVFNNEIIEIENAEVIQKYEDKLYIYYSNYLFGTYNIETNEITTLKKYTSNNFFMRSGLVINETGKYALVYASRYDYKFSFSDQLNKYYITIFNMETYKQAAVKCIDFRKNFYQVHSYTWVE